MPWRLSVTHCIVLIVLFDIIVSVIAE